MPVRAVTSRFMYRGLCSIPDILSYKAPVSLPEDEVEGEWYFILSWRETLSVAIVLPVLCECGFQYHGERPAAAFTAHNKESACFFLHATDFFFMYTLLVCDDKIFWKNCTYLHLDCGFAYEQTQSD